MALRACLALVMWALLGASALAQSYQQFGVGDAPRSRHDILDAARAPLIGTIDHEALRFSSQPALGREGYVITLLSNGHVVIAWFDGHPSLGWRSTRQTTFRISESEYQRVATQIDRLMVQGVAEIHDDAIPVCADGAGYLTERFREGEASWLRPLCGGVNNEIANFLTSWAFRYLGR